MKLVLKNSLVILMSILVGFLSMGVNVSKMLCAKNGKIYIGKELIGGYEDLEKYIEDHEGDFF